MNRERLVWRARKLAGRGETDTTTDPTDVLEAVKDAYVDVLDLEDWSFLRTVATLPVVGGTQAYTLPAAVRRVDSVTIDDGQTRGILRPRTGRSRDALSDAPKAGAPSEYVLRDPYTIELWPEPKRDGTVEVRGWSHPAPLAAGESPMFSEPYHQVVAYLAAVALLEQAPREDGDDRIERYEQRAGLLIERMRSHYQRQHDRTPLVIGGRRQTHRGRRVPFGGW